MRIARRATRPVTILIASLGAIVALLPLAVLLPGPARSWSVFGPADLGPVDFARLERRSSPNDALARPDALPGAARAEIAATVFAVDARALRDTMARAVAEERDLGANRARIERWLARLTRVAPVAP